MKRPTPEQLPPILTHYQVSITLNFWAENVDHAEEQFVNAIEDDIVAWTVTDPVNAQTS